mgnify:CR=1 FL=1
MKIRVSARHPDTIQKTYPIKGRVNGWYFRKTEISNGVWQVEGMDIYGRKVGRSGPDPDELLNKCESDAKDINATLNPGHLVTRQNHR